MKQGILILAHGSRQKETEETLQAVVSLLKGKLPEMEIETAFLQFSERNLEYGLNALMKKGIEEIKVIPYFLFEGVHLKEDIPKEIEDFLKDHPNMKITLGRTLGADQRLAEILKDRILEMM